MQYQEERRLQVCRVGCGVLYLAQAQEILAGCVANETPLTV